MACRGKCETDVSEINEVIRHNRKLPAQLASANKQIVFWLAILGLLVTGINAVNWMQGHGPGYVIAGIVILLMAFFYHRATRKHGRRA